MSYAELSAMRVLSAAAKARKAPGHPQFAASNEERLRHLVALASAVQHDPFTNDRMQVTAADFALLAPFWEPAINF